MNSAVMSPVRARHRPLLDLILLTLINLSQLTFGKKLSFCQHVRSILRTTRCTHTQMRTHTCVDELDTAHKIHHKTPNYLVLERERRFISASLCNEEQNEIAFQDALFSAVYITAGCFSK